MSASKIRDLVLLDETTEDAIYETLSSRFVVYKGES
jgi:hypothetical protein